MFDMKRMFAAALLIAVSATAAGARDSEIEYPEGALGYNALMAKDYSTAAEQLKESAAHKDDPARLINYGYVLAKTGQMEKAASQFKRAMSVDNVELIVADGSTVDSRELARKALEALETDGLGR
jgi:Tfp pilus assembly protein PilF